MGRMIDDSVKQKLLDSLAEEPTMVLSTAYAYAKNYVLYGEDITKEWTTAVQQVSVIQKARQEAWVEAYDSFKKEYENRLKADIVAMLTDIQSEFKEGLRCKGCCNNCVNACEDIPAGWFLDFIDAKINSLKENKDG